MSVLLHRTIDLILPPRIAIVQRNKSGECCWTRTSRPSPPRSRRQATSDDRPVAAKTLPGLPPIPSLWLSPRRLGEPRPAADLPGDGGREARRPCSGQARAEGRSARLRQAGSGGTRARGEADRSAKPAAPVAPVVAETAKPGPLPRPPRFRRTQSQGHHHGRPEHHRKRRQGYRRQDPGLFGDAQARTQASMERAPSCSKT